jgi:hypothetical protein
MITNREVLGLIYESCVGHCYYCGRPQEVFGDWQVEHMLPRQQGGTDDLYNLTLACKLCNRRKGNRTVEQFRTYLHQRALTGLNEVSDLLMEYDQPSDLIISQANEQVIQAYDAMLDQTLLFFGEINNIPRKFDHRFKPPGGVES